MWRLPFLIWAVANLSVFAVFCLALVPGLGFSAFLYSSLFSLPAVPLLRLLLSLLHWLRGHFVFSWFVLLVGTGLCSLAVYGLFVVSFPGAEGELDFVLPLSLMAGYGAVLALSFSVQTLFLKFYYGND